MIHRLVAKVYLRALPISTETNGYKGSIPVSWLALSLPETINESTKVQTLGTEFSPCIACAV